MTEDAATQVMPKRHLAKVSADAMCILFRHSNMLNHNDQTKHVN